MITKRTIIIPASKALQLIPKVIHRNVQCYYLSDNYAQYTNLSIIFKDRVTINNLSGMFQEIMDEVKWPFLELVAKLNKKYNSLGWWGGQISSRSTSETPLILYVVYLFCAKKILSDSYRDVIFIVNSRALAGCISDSAIQLGYYPIIYEDKVDKYLENIRRWLRYLAQIVYFFWYVLQSRRSATKLFNTLPPKTIHSDKRIVIRSWVTDSNFDKSGIFKDRNFGSLPEWLRSRNYEVITLPMFFNLNKKLKEIYALMKKNKEQTFLIPDVYLNISDYIKVLYNSYKVLRIQIQAVEIKNTNIAPLFNEVKKIIGFSPNLIIYNLSYPMLHRLKEKGAEIDTFFYSFENNPPEKQFILGCRKFFSDSKVIGYQHTTFFPNQLAYHLGPGEKDYHPLPDKLVCSGPIYVKMHREAGFPSKILIDGPNLRFESVYIDVTKGKDVETNKKKNILISLTFSYDLAFESIAKVNKAIEGDNNYQLYIRNHPLLSKEVLIKYLKNIKIMNYKFADDKIIQEWLPQMYALITTGGSITTLEAVSIGTPLIRIIPDNTFHFDSFHWPDYPLKPVNQPVDIKEQLKRIDEILAEDKETFIKIAKKVLKSYFTRPTEENLKVFISGSSPG